MNLEPDAGTSSSLEILEEPNIVKKEAPAISFVETSYSAPNSQVSMFSFEEPRCNSPPHMGAGQQLPPLGHPGTYDPNRIPASIFGPKPANHSEWSVASTESLFSIHMGNNSFSKDHVFMLYKSGDLQEMSNYFPPPLKPVMEVESVEIKGEDTTEKVSKVRTESNDHNAKTGQEIPDITERQELYAEPEKTVNQENSPIFEEVRNSSSSTQSFQFPVINYEEERNSSVKKEKQQQKQLSVKQELGHDDLEESKPQAITKTSKPLRGLKNNWLSCFSRCPFGC